MRVCRHFSIACEIVGREGTWGSGLGRLALQARDQGGGKYHEVSAFASPQQLDNQRHSALGVAKNSSPLLTRRVAPASSRGASGVPEATGTSNHRRNLRRSAMTGGVAVAELAVGHGAVGVRDGGAGARPGGAVSGKTTGVSG